VCPIERLVQHKPRSHFGICAGSARSWTTLSRGRAISIETVYFMAERSRFARTEHTVALTEMAGRQGFFLLDSRNANKDGRF
jgi:hypothetical protein